MKILKLIVNNLLFTLSFVFPFNPKKILEIEVLITFAYGPDN